MLLELSRGLPRWWCPLVLFFIAVVVLAACDTADRIGGAVNVLHAGYCEASPDARAALRSVLVFDDGSPKVVVHCEPHGG